MFMIDLKEEQDKVRKYGTTKPLILPRSTGHHHRVIQNLAAYFSTALRRPAPHDRGYCLGSSLKQVARQTLNFEPDQTIVLDVSTTHRIDIAVVLTFGSAIAVGR
jgi:hypothetical protein